MAGRAVAVEGAGAVGAGRGDGAIKIEASMTLFRPSHNRDSVRENLLARCRFAAGHFNYLHYDQRFGIDEIDEAFLDSLDDEELYEMSELFADAVFRRPIPQPQNIIG